MKRLLVFGLSLMVLGVTAIHAGIGAKNGEIGFDFGATQFDTSVTDTIGGRFVFRVGYHFTDLFQLEGHLASSTGTESFAGIDFDTTLTTVMVNAVFNFHPENDSIVPYVLFGVGTANGEQEIIGLTLVDENGSAYQYGGGSRFFFGANKRAAFRVELTGLSEEIGPETSTHANLVIGFTWRLGESR